MSFDGETLKTYGLYALIAALVAYAIWYFFLRKDRFENESEEFLGLFGNEKFDEEDSDDEDSDDEDSDDEEGFEDEDSDEEDSDDEDDEMDDESYDM